jgi:hypothetical protein
MGLMIIKEKTEKCLCDICNKTIPITSRGKFNTICKLCNKDICFRHRLVMKRRWMVRSYKYSEESVGAICTDCGKKLRIYDEKRNKKNDNT